MKKNFLEKKETDDLKIEIIEISFHRNGVDGIGFHAVLFTATVDTGDGVRRQKMVATVFDEKGACAVLAVEPLSTKVGVKFGHNSWRGDTFEGILRKAIQSTKSSGSIRIGPFCLPVE